MATTDRVQSKTPSTLIQAVVEECFPIIDYILDYLAQKHASSPSRTRHILNARYLIYKNIIKGEKQVSKKAIAFIALLLRDVIKGTRSTKHLRLLSCTVEKLARCVGRSNKELESAPKDQTNQVPGLLPYEGQLYSRREYTPNYLPDGTCKMFQKERGGHWPSDKNNTQAFFGEQDVLEKGKPAQPVGRELGHPDQATPAKGQGCWDQGRVESEGGQKLDHTWPEQGENHAPRDYDYRNFNEWVGKSVENAKAQPEKYWWPAFTSEVTNKSNREQNAPKPTSNFRERRSTPGNSRGPSRWDQNESKKGEDTSVWNLPIWPQNVDSGIPNRGGFNFEGTNNTTQSNIGESAPLVSSTFGLPNWLQSGVFSPPSLGEIDQRNWKASNVQGNELNTKKEESGPLPYKSYYQSRWDQPGSNQLFNRRVPQETGSVQSNKRENEQSDRRHSDVGNRKERVSDHSSSFSYSKKEEEEGQVSHGWSGQRDHTRRQPYSRNWERGSWRGFGNTQRRSLAGWRRESSRNDSADWRGRVSNSSQPTESRRYSTETEWRRSSDPHSRGGPDVEGGRRRSDIEGSSQGRGWARGSSGRGRPDERGRYCTDGQSWDRSRSRLTEERGRSRIVERSQDRSRSRLDKRDCSRVGGRDQSRGRSLGPDERGLSQIGHLRSRGRSCGPDGGSRPNVDSRLVRGRSLGPERRESPESRGQTSHLFSSVGQGGLLRPDPPESCSQPDPEDRRVGLPVKDNDNSTDNNVSVVSLRQKLSKEITTVHKVGFSAGGALRSLSNKTNNPSTNSPSTNSPSTNSPSTNSPSTNSPSTNSPSTNVTAITKPSEMKGNQRNYQKQFKKEVPKDKKSLNFGSVKNKPSDKKFISSPLCNLYDLPSGNTSAIQNFKIPKKRKREEISSDDSPTKKCTTPETKPKPNDEIALMITKEVLGALSLQTGMVNQDSLLDKITTILSGGGLISKPDENTRNVARSDTPKSAKTEDRIGVKQVDSQNEAQSDTEIAPDASRCHRTENVQNTKSVNKNDAPITKAEVVANTSVQKSVLTIGPNFQITPRMLADPRLRKRLERELQSDPEAYSLYKSKIENQDSSGSNSVAPATTKDKIPDSRTESNEENEKQTRSEEGNITDSSSNQVCIKGSISGSSETEPIGNKTSEKVDKPDLPVDDSVPLDDCPDTTQKSDPIEKCSPDTTQKSDPIEKCSPDTTQKSDPIEKCSLDTTQKSDPIEKCSPDTTQKSDPIEKCDLPDTKDDLSVEKLAPLSDKEVSNSQVVSEPVVVKKKIKGELDKLHDDINNMYIGKDVVRAYGARKCRDKTLLALLTKTKPVTKTPNKTVDKNEAVTEKGDSALKGKKKKRSAWSQGVFAKRRTRRNNNGTDEDGVTKCNIPGSVQSPVDESPSGSINDDLGDAESTELKSSTQDVDVPSSEKTLEPTAEDRVDPEKDASKPVAKQKTKTRKAAKSHFSKRKKRKTESHQGQRASASLESGEVEELPPEAKVELIKDLKIKIINGSKQVIKQNNGSASEMASEEVEGEVPDTRANKAEGLNSSTTIEENDKCCDKVTEPNENLNVPDEKLKENEDSIDRLKNEKTGAEIVESAENKVSGERIKDPDPKIKLKRLEIIPGQTENATQQETKFAPSGIVEAEKSAKQPEKVEITSKQPYISIEPLKQLNISPPVGASTKLEIEEPEKLPSDLPESVSTQSVKIPETSPVEKEDVAASDSAKIDSAENMTEPELKQNELTQNDDDLPTEVTDELPADAEENMAALADELFETSMYSFHREVSNSDKVWKLKRLHKQVNTTVDVRPHGIDSMEFKLDLSINTLGIEDENLNFINISSLSVNRNNIPENLTVSKFPEPVEPLTEDDSGILVTVGPFRIVPVKRMDLAYLCLINGCKFLTSDGRTIISHTETNHRNIYYNWSCSHCEVITVPSINSDFARYDVCLAVNHLVKEHNLEACRRAYVAAKRNKGELTFHQNRDRNSSDDELDNVSDSLEENDTLENGLESKSQVDNAPQSNDRSRLDNNAGSSSKEVVNNSATPRTPETEPSATLANSEPRSGMGAVSGPKKTGTHSSSSSTLHQKPVEQNSANEVTTTSEAQKPGTSAPPTLLGQSAPPESSSNNQIAGPSTSGLAVNGTTSGASTSGSTTTTVVSGPQVPGERWATVLRPEAESLPKVREGKISRLLQRMKFEYCKSFDSSNRVITRPAPPPAETAPGTSSSPRPSRSKEPSSTPQSKSPRHNKPVSAPASVPAKPQNGSSSGRLSPTAKPGTSRPSRTDKTAIKGTRTPLVFLLPKGTNQPVSDTSLGTPVTPGSSKAEVNPPTVVAQPTAQNVMAPGSLPTVTATSQATGPKRIVIQKPPLEILPVTIPAQNVLPGSSRVVLKQPETLLPTDTVQSRGQTSLPTSMPPPVSVPPKAPGSSRTALKRPVEVPPAQTRGQNVVSKLPQVPGTSRASGLARILRNPGAKTAVNSRTVQNKNQNTPTPGFTRSPVTSSPSVGVLTQRFLNVSSSSSVSLNDSAIGKLSSFEQITLKPAIVSPSGQAKSQSGTSFIPLLVTRPTPGSSTEPSESRPSPSVKETSTNLFGNEVKEIRKTFDLKRNTQYTRTLSNIGCMYAKNQKLTDLFKCMGEGCKFTTSSYFSAQVHFNEHQAKSSSSSNSWRTCIYCNLQLPLAKDFVLHILYEHGRSVYQCPYCSYRTVSIPNIVLHQTLEHKGLGGTTLILKCHRHPITFIPPEMPVSGQLLPYTCKIKDCKVRTHLPSMFGYHFKTHNRIKHYPCPHCPFESPSVFDLTEHMENHGIAKYQCYYCLSGSNDMEEMRSHVCTSHPSRRPQFLMREMYRASLTKGPASVSTITEHKTEIESIVKFIFDELSETDLSYEMIHTPKPNFDREDPQTPVEKLEDNELYPLYDFSGRKLTARINVIDDEGDDPSYITISSDEENQDGMSENLSCQPGASQSSVRAKSNLNAPEAVIYDDDYENVPLAQPEIYIDRFPIDEECSRQLEEARKSSSVDVIHDLDKPSTSGGLIKEKGGENKSNTSDRNKHESSHLNSWVCGYCSFASGIATQVTEHLEEAHPGLKKYMFKKNDPSVKVARKKTFSKKLNPQKERTPSKEVVIQAHNSNELEDDDAELVATGFSCTRCNHKVPSIASLEVHFKEQHPSEPLEYFINNVDGSVQLAQISYICYICGSVFPDLYKLKFHHGRKHALLPLEYVRQRNIFKCPACDETSDSYGAVSDHIVKFHKNVYACGKCDQFFTTKIKSVDHFKREHENEKLTVRYLRGKNKNIGMIDRIKVYFTHDFKKSVPGVSDKSGENANKFSAPQTARKSTGIKKKSQPTKPSPVNKKVNPPPTVDTEIDISTIVPNYNFNSKLVLKRV